MSGKLNIPEISYETTLWRLAKIKGHLSTRPRSERLKDKVCIVTGVGSLIGIGRASALLFAHEGARALYLLDFDGTHLPGLKDTINKQYPDVNVTVVQGDAADEQAIQNLVSRAVKEEGRLDVFFANAGIFSPKLSVFDCTVKEWERVMHVNTTSCFLAIKYAGPAMQITSTEKSKEDAGGSIIMTASVAGIRSGAGPVDYSASKAAVNNMAKSAAWNLANTNVRVNSICPGLIETGMTAPTFDTARKRGSEGKIGQLNPTGRYGVPEEIANVALFLACDDSSYVNGQNWAVDGGLSASHPVVPGKFA